MTETPHEISSRLSPLRDKIINPATRGLRPRFARNKFLVKCLFFQPFLIISFTILSRRGSASVKIAQVIYSPRNNKMIKKNVTCDQAFFFRRSAKEKQRETRRSVGGQSGYTFALLRKITPDRRLRKMWGSVQNYGKGRISKFQDVWNLNFEVKYTPPTADNPLGTLRCILTQ